MTTDATCGAFATSAADSLTAFAYLDSVSLPLEACSTIGLVPLAWSGNEWLSVSVACWLSVPGSDRLSLVFSPNPCETPTSAIVTSSHTAIVTKRCRTQNFASPYSTPVTAQYSWLGVATRQSSPLGVGVSSVVFRSRGHRRARMAACHRRPTLAAREHRRPPCGIDIRRGEYLPPCRGGIAGGFGRGPRRLGC